MNIKPLKPLLAFFFISALLSGVELAGRSIDRLEHPSRQPLHSLSAQFTGLKNLFRQMPRAGYYTDKDLQAPLVIAQFEQAQYVLAPTILEINNTNLPLVIFDCSSPQAAMAKIQELGLVPLSASNTGLVLAVNKGYKP